MSAMYKGRDAAIQESFRNQCQGEYFRARPQLDFAGNNRIFEKAFDMGWTSAMAESERRVAAVLYLFAAYLTTIPRERAVTLSAAHSAGPAAEHVAAFAKRCGINLANPDMDAFNVVDDSVEMPGPPPDTVPGDVVVQQMIDKSWARFCAVADGCSAGQDSKPSPVDSELEVERLRLAACGVVARANTPDSALEARRMHDKYRSDSLDAVADAVDREMHYRRLCEQIRDVLKGDSK